MEEDTTTSTTTTSTATTSAAGGEAAAVAAVHGNTAGTATAKKLPKIPSDVWEWHAG
jgi:hypothetical protein